MARNSWLEPFARLDELRLDELRLDELRLVGVQKA